VQYWPCSRPSSLYDSSEIPVSRLPGTLRSIGLVCVLPGSQNLLEDSLPLAAINQKMPLAG
jgi:hypothetical protein